MDSRSLVLLQGPRIPEMLGNFLLDDHNVEEWSDDTKPGTKHRARKEVGKWIDPDRNADIKYQKREDTKQFESGKERSRTEVIKGTAPDSVFQIVHSHRQFQDSDEKTGARVSSTSTSYQMSSSSGMRATTKTSSNKSSSKTVTISGGRSDEFENLRIAFHPLDTSTQRERINVSRSGTMGVRRPPTRRHHPPALVTTPTQNFQKEEEEEKFSSSLSITGFKNISPKIRVGFPVEIQLELQTKLRSSVEDRKPPQIHRPDKAYDGVSTGEKNNEPSEDLNGSANKSEESAFDFAQRRKSFGFESFDSTNAETDDVFKIPKLTTQRSLSRSWDLIQSPSNPSMKTNFKSGHSRFMNSSPSLSHKPPQVPLSPLDENPPSEKVDMFDKREESPLSTPDIIHFRKPDSSPSNPLLSSTNFLDQTPDLLNKMTFSKEFYPARAEQRNLDETCVDDEDGMKSLQDSLTQILDNVDSEIGQWEARFKTSSNIVFNKTREEKENAENCEFGDNEEYLSPGGKSASQVSHTWISSERPCQTARDSDVTTSISGVQEPSKRCQKKVGFCKTEVHFTPDSGKFHIVETDENKPSTVHLFRRKKRGEKRAAELRRDTKEVLEAMRVSDLEQTQRGRNDEHDEVSFDHSPRASPEWCEEKGTDETLVTYHDKQLPKDEEEKPSFPPTKDFHFPSPNHHILSNYEELKIQRYLKDIKSPSSPSTTRHSFNEDDEETRFQNVLYENGAFVPLATRLSLIEMNNRNRKRGSLPNYETNAVNNTTTEFSLQISDDGPNHFNFSDHFNDERKEEGNESLKYSENKRTQENLSSFDNSLSVEDDKTIPTTQPTSGSDEEWNDFSSSLPEYVRSFNCEKKENLRDDFQYQYSKPLSPVLPVKFTFEKSPDGQLELLHGNVTMMDDSGHVGKLPRFSTRNSLYKVPPTQFPSKSIVNITGYDEYHKVKDEEPMSIQDLQPTLTKDHTWTWKGHSHFRSSEPEWVEKAKMREKEGRVRDWSAVGKQAITKPDPPWISEMKFKSKSTSDDLRSTSKSRTHHAVYPWEVTEMKTEEPPLPPRPPPIQNMTISEQSFVEKKEDNLPKPPQKPGKKKPYIESQVESGKIEMTEVKSSEEIKKKEVESETRREVAKVAISENCPRNKESRRPLQTLHSSTSNKVEKKSVANEKSLEKRNSGEKPKAPPRPPKPPQRISSLPNKPPEIPPVVRECEKKPRSSGFKPVYSNYEIEAMSRPNTHIHVHPTVKISKLPIRNQMKTPSPDGKTSGAGRSNKSKTHVSLISEAKRLCKSKFVDQGVPSKERSSGEGSHHRTIRLSGKLGPSVTPKMRSK